MWKRPPASQTNGQSTDFSSKLPDTPDFSRTRFPYLYGVRNGARSGRAPADGCPAGTLRETPAPAAASNKPPISARRLGSNITSIELEAHAQQRLPVVDGVAVRDGLRAVERNEPGAQEVGTLRVHRPVVGQLVVERGIQPAELLGEDRVGGELRRVTGIYGSVELATPGVSRPEGHRSLLVDADEIGRASCRERV